MGILKAISDAIKEKAKEEVVKYLKKIAEEQGKGTAEKSSKPVDRRDEHKSASSGYSVDREEERRRRDVDNERRGRFERRDRHERDHASHDKGDRTDRWQERLERYREKYHDDFQDRRDRDEKVRRDREQGRDEMSLQDEEKLPFARPEPKEMPVAQKTVSPRAADPDKKPEPPSPQEPVQKPIAVTGKPVATVARKEEWIAPLNDKPIEKVQIALGTDEAAVPVDLGRMIQQLPPLEYALYLKLYLYSFSIRKNYGYVGAGLKKNVGLADLDSAEFERLLQRLEKRGLLALEKISEFQSTYVLYLPFDADRMGRVEEKKEEENGEPSSASAEHPASSPAAASEFSREEKPATSSKAEVRATGKSGGSTGKQAAKKGKTREEVAKKSARDAKEGGEAKGKRKASLELKKPDRREDSEPATAPSEPEMTAPGAADLTMDDEQLAKSYRTFVSMEIDKAKMRVGRSNFDKIYMEAVKYIDKKYGFKVLSDQERFREYLTQYYISAFDIPSFEEWKKSKA